jgi:OOP family OmpA-OmpF porin
MSKDSENIVPRNQNKSLDELRELILGLKPEELQVLQLWLKNREAFTEEIGRVLPNAVLKSIEFNMPLGERLLPVIEEAIFTSVQNNPKTLADALFPVMGAAIRKSIADTFREMIQSLNQTLEKKFSFERILWRFEALFSDKSYAEIILLKGVQYNIKSVFLIHKASGLLIQEAYSNDFQFDDADMVSSMLTAVQDFVKDSFSKHIQSNDTLDTIKLNDFNVWIENGPLAYMAVVIEGTPQESARELFKTNLENIHGKYSSILNDFEGDSDTAIPLKPYLKNCIISHKTEEKQTSHTKIVTIASIIILILGTWAFYSIRNQYRWNGFMDELKTQPSIVILDHGYESGRYYIHGMKDILLKDFGKFATSNQIDSSQIDFKWTSYISMEPTFVYYRTIHKIQPTPDVTTQLSGDTIFILGKAPDSWILKTKEFITQQENPIHFNLSQLENTSADSISKLEIEFEEQFIKFSFGVSYLVSENKLLLDHISQMFYKYQSYYPNSNLSIRIAPDNSGSKTGNIQFAKKRFRSVSKYLISKGISEHLVTLEIDTTQTALSPRKMTFKPIKTDK